ncbi:beta-ketoacyl synthase N-terminal-like domain-containing protein [Pedosphaera parvula]|uniref:Beta-ketoacyl synthase n=1 Tax=Pedosphaera parvula (strain Ellin514) TaxID=320771 RepID=B9XGA4_PEDPL|nr:beta-ketoacyl synthase N-terminal-like domain-containing protein [Pedosphaera parvula]EEF61266.1 Beta-ketoacyl synthase [Pedosphaera parvula Ellin514]
MSRIYIAGCGAVSPAGWSVQQLCDAIHAAAPIPVKPLTRPGWPNPLTVRQVVSADPKPSFMGHARLRRTSPITQYVVSAALEALGDDLALVRNGTLRLGIVLCVMSGCVNYTRRFFDETVKDPSTASPLIFPETVFNAPSSHIATLLGTKSMNYSIVGDPGTFLQGLALGAQWLAQGNVDGCLVLAGEECDWLTSDAFRHFSRKIILSDGAGAIYLKAGVPGNSSVELRSITDSHLFSRDHRRDQAIQRVAEQLPPCSPDHLLCDGLQGVPRIDAPEIAAWKSWNGARVSPKSILGEGLMAAASWQCIHAIQALRMDLYPAASVSVLGCNQQAIGAHFTATKGV